VKYLKKNSSQCHFVHHKSHMDWPGIQPFKALWLPSSHTQHQVWHKKQGTLSTQPLFPYKAWTDCRHSVLCEIWTESWYSRLMLAITVLTMSKCDKHFDRIRMYIPHIVLNTKYENLRQQNYSWWVGIAQSVLWLHWVEFPAGVRAFFLSLNIHTSLTQWIQGLFPQQ
jgi:hypothetical protein